MKLGVLCRWLPFGVAICLVSMLVGACGLAREWHAGREAKSMAKEYWAARVIKCGDSWYDLGDPLSLAQQYGGMERPPVYQVLQFKDFSYNTRAKSLSDADRLNGYEWNGETGINCRFYRSWNSIWGWQDWRNCPVPRVPTISIATVEPIFKKEGRWYYWRYDAAALKQVASRDCGEIPK